jgi:ferric-dicitrate binding protein FerR (iron transport regulator)
MVTVESGKVAINMPLPGEATIELKKDEQLTYYPKKQHFEKKPVNAAMMLDWRNGILRFQSTTMAEVEHILERWYGIEVEVQDKRIYNKKFSGIHKNENLVSVLESLSYALKANYELNGMNVKLKN